MNELKKELQEFFKSHAASTYFVAVSGGLDSMVLLNLMFELQLPLHVLHLNYHLRGIDSDEDESLVRSFCQLNSIPFTLESIDLKAKLNQKKANLQNEARKVRYDFFRREQAKIPNSCIVLAHHQNDQIETFFLQLLRGSGIAGLAGMKAKNGYFLRPLLPFSKQELKTFAIENNIQWREDVSNSKSDYARNKWRNEIIPFLNQEITSLEKSVLIIQKHFQEKLIEIEEKITQISNQINKNKRLEISVWSSLEAVEKIELLKNLEIPTYLFGQIDALATAQKGAKVEWKTENKKKELIKEDCYLHLLNEPLETSIPEFKTERIKALPSTFSKNVLVLDETKIKGELTIRKWQLGDRISPIGLKGSKLISDILKDAKVANHLRENQFVLVDEEKIIACVGFSIDRRAIATKESLTILKVTFS